MKKQHGIYALVMSLKKARTIKVGKLETFDFPRGWYVYVGSAHGSGGVKVRTDRHRRGEQHKKKRWHVDYFRSFAPISEIWFSHAPKYREHDWARTVMLMSGSSIPVIKFGVYDCYPRCEAHFFHFDNRPFPAEFHADVLRILPEHSPIYTEVVKPNATDAVDLDGAALPTLLDYDRGRRYLELRRRAEYDGLLEAHSEANIRSFAQGTFERRLIEKTAPAMRVSSEQLIDDAKFALAVETIANNCDGGAFRAMFNPKNPQTRKSIMQLSRTADTRQQYRIEGVLDGWFRSVGPKPSDGVYDTVGYYEVTSRLSRARGSIQMCQEMLANCGDQIILDDTGKIVGACRRAAKKLRAFAQYAESKPAVIPKTLSRDVVNRMIARCNATGYEIGSAKMALKFTIKSVWDFPEMQRRRLLPTDKEGEATRVEIETIIETANEIPS